MTDYKVKFEVFEGPLDLLEGLPIKGVAVLSASPLGFRVAVSRAQR